MMLLTLATALSFGSPLSTFAVLAPPGGGEWSRFRGPNGAGVMVADRPLPAELDPAKNLLWKLELAPGHSSPCIWGERIFLTEHVGDELATVCIDRASGERLWRRAVAAEQIERYHRVNSPASPTAAADGERVYVYFGSVGLLCYDHAGEELWRRTHPVPENTFGTAASPVLAGGHLVWVSDTNEESKIEALDPATGEPVWTRDRSGFRSGWSTPVVRSQGATEELLVYGAWWLKAYDVSSGEELWAVPGLTDEPCTTPVASGELVFVTSYNMRTNPEVIGLPEFAQLLEQHDANGDGVLSKTEAEENESVLSRHDADGEGDHPLRIFFRFLDEDRDGQIDASEWVKLVDWLNGFEHANGVLAIRTGGEKPEIAWQFPRGVPECPSPVLYDGRLYVVKNGGLLSCFEAESGALKFQERIGARGPCYASLVAGDGKVYSASARGVVTVIAAGDELRVLSRNDLGERIMATPALVDGRVYVRTDAALYAFGSSD